MPPGGPKKILTIDDSKLSRLQVKLVLEKKGFAVLELDNIADYLNFPWNYSDVSLILLDLCLPGASGIDLLKRMREDDSRFWPPVIIISSIQESQTIANAIKLGAKDYLIKPFNEVDLLQRIEKLFGSAGTSDTTPPKQLWSFFFTANSSLLGTGVAIIDGNTVVGGTSAFYFTGLCNLNSNPVSARLTVTRFAPGQSVFGAEFNSYTLVLKGSCKEGEASLSGHMEDNPENKVTSLMKKLVNL